MIVIFSCFIEINFLEKNKDVVLVIESKLYILYFGE